ncbi:hypothetical protein [Alicyclobacillus sp. ALC3]|uniref:hypothetical protein n=1 Tax=Alicyclobacillus sp. ALC3 TaxID=2796143 RepID=UPI002378D750|nr:hypothetical protein [Alicyclobacillus sp. ALC3]WDL98475.1 hypothetical protein JC200_07275 [Alicyclobacillus sp. ALC3]
MASKRIEADFSEDTVGFALESFLAVLSFPMYRFSIEHFTRSKERWLGADARLYSHVKSFKPFYMQFKKPSAYPDISTSKIIKDRKNLSPQLEFLHEYSFLSSERRRSIMLISSIIFFTVGGIV